MDLARALVFCRGASSRWYGRSSSVVSPLHPLSGHRDPNMFAIYFGLLHRTSSRGYAAFSVALWIGSHSRRTAWGPSSTRISERHRHKPLQALGRWWHSVEGSDRAQALSASPRLILHCRHPVAERLGILPRSLNYTEEQLYNAHSSSLSSSIDSHAAQPSALRFCTFFSRCCGRTGSGCRRHGRLRQMRQPLQRRSPSNPSFFHPHSTLPSLPHPFLYSGLS